MNKRSLEVKFINSSILVDYFRNKIVLLLLLIHLYMYIRDGWRGRERGKDAKMDRCEGKKPFMVI